MRISPPRHPSHPGKISLEIFSLKNTDGTHACQFVNSTSRDSFPILLLRPPSHRRPCKFHRGDTRSEPPFAITIHRMKRTSTLALLLFAAACFWAQTPRDTLLLGAAPASQAAAAGSAEAKSLPDSVHVIVKESFPVIDSKGAEYKEGQPGRLRHARPGELHAGVLVISKAAFCRRHLPPPIPADYDMRSITCCPGSAVLPRQGVLPTQRFWRSTSDGYHRFRHQYLQQLHRWKMGSGQLRQHLREP